MNATSAVVPPQASTPVLTQADGAIYRIVLNRPDARNPLGAETVDALDCALAEGEANPDIRVILITANGPAFSAGGNLGNIGERLAAPPDADGNDPIALGNRRYGRFLERLVATPKMTVVAAQGAAMGGGAGLLCAADLAIGVPEAPIGFPEVSIGLVPAQILPFVASRIGLQQARRMMLTGERIDGNQAYRIGLLDYLAASVQTLPATIDAVLDRCLTAAPGAAAATKQMLQGLFGLDAWHQRDLTAYLDAASQTFAKQMRTEAIEGIAAAKGRRPAAWHALAAHSDSRDAKCGPPRGSSQP